MRGWQTSGLSQAAYCRSHGLSAKTFGNWLRAKRGYQYMILNWSKNDYFNCPRRCI
ncbi:IS66 family insertion sequence element accessory protein TnpA [Nitrosomonas mobilis]|uniref:IS66 family insertion sequence element accessory protein TnpA n=1 Tax=Nitrosomonas mobilis TaxID=51642 RepID=UPI003CCBAC1F